MTKKDIKELLEKHANGTSTAEEEELLNYWFHHKSVTGDWNWEDDEDQKRTGRHIKNHINKSIFKKNKIRPLRIWILSTAALIAVVCTITYLNLSKPDIAISKQMSFTENVVAPGTTSAQLTLADGTVVNLDEHTKGVVSMQGKTAVKQLKTGELTYDHVKPGQSTSSSLPELLNTIRIPKGGLYHLILSDGTKVWLNSSSSLSYPSSFNGKERFVNLTGEAYFEIAKNKSIPFKVSAKGALITVTGTHFNVSAYENDDKVVATLIEGGVDIGENDTHKVKLKPGEQAIKYDNNDLLEIKKVDPENSIAWKNGEFAFDNQDIATIMKNISRWYDLEVVFNGHVNGKRLSGTYSKSKHIDELLNYMETLSGIKFKKEGRRVTVMP